VLLASRGDVFVSLPTSQHQYGGVLRLFVDAYDLPLTIWRRWADVSGRKDCSARRHAWP